MTNVVRFKAKSEWTAEQNLQTFIENCRKHLIAFGSDNWLENNWSTYKNTRKVIARFSTNLKPSNSYHFEPLSSPFIEFAKAYIKNVYTDNPVSNLQRHMEAIRILEEALILGAGEADILRIDGTVLARLNDVFHRQLSDATARNKAGYQMELILNFCRKQLIAPGLPEWSNPYPKEKDLTIAVDEEGNECRKDKMPTNEEMMLVADIFSKAPVLGIEAEYFTAVFALLMCAPSRCSEEFELPVNCLEWEENRAGVEKLGIRWVAAKKGKAKIKWVPTEMEDVVVEAVERLKRIGKPAREAAKFAEENPGQFNIHSGCITPAGFSLDDALSIEQFNAAISTDYASLDNNVIWLTKLRDENNGNISYRSLGAHEYQKYTRKFPNWPYVDKNKNVKASEALLLHRENEFHADFNTRGFSFSLPTVNHVNDRFVEKDAKGDRTLWAKHGFSLKSGESIELNTHCARHWLSTMSEDGGMGELHLANWAGRAQVSDNRKYDNRPEAEKAEQTAELMIPEDANVLEKIKHRIPISFVDVGKDLPGSAIVTELGICEHDYAILPCQSNGDCETCKELVCIKGFSDSLKILKKRETEVKAQLSKAIKDEGAGVFGADRWVSSHIWRITHIRTKISLLENENIPEGAVIRMPEEYDPSPVKEMLRDKGLANDIKQPADLDVPDDIFKLMEL